VCSDQKQRLALVWVELGQRRAEVLIVEVSLLVRVGLEPCRIGAIRVLHLALALAVLGVEAVT
jgi:hypothetical protein